MERLIKNVLNIYQYVLLTEFEKIHFKFLKKNNFFLDETEPKLLELSLKNILNEIHLIQDSLSKKDYSNSNKNKTSQELLHKKLDDAEEEQNK